MKYFALFLIIAGFFMSPVYCAVGFINGRNSKYPNQCYWKGPPKILMSLDTSKRIPGQCGAYRCQSNYKILIETCGTVGANMHCRVIKGDISKPFPYCCDEFIC